MFVAVLASFLVQACLLAASSPLPNPAPGRPSLCPTPEGLWQELVGLLPQQDVRARLLAAGTDEPQVQVQDLGASFRVSLLERTREYRDEARDCARRARVAALFAALVLEPNAPVPADTPPTPQPPAGSPPKPQSPLSAASPSVIGSEPPTHAQARLEGGAAMMDGLDGQAGALSWGGMLRLFVGKGRVGPVLGVGAFWPTDTTMGGVRLRQWRVPVDLGVRVVATTGAVSWHGELALVAAMLGESARGLATSKSGTAFEIGGRVALGARWESRASIAPFVALSLDVIPDPPLIVALPMGEVGRTPTLWLGTTLGASWGIR